MKLSDDLNPRAIIVKGVMFLAITLFCFGYLVSETKNFKTALVAGILIWAAARFYYFLFYVIEKYVDPSFKYSGVLDMIKSLRKK